MSRKPKMRLVKGPGPRRADCVHEPACCAEASFITTGPAHCPKDCRWFERRDSRVSERDIYNGRGGDVSLGGGK